MDISSKDASGVIAVRTSDRSEDNANWNYGKISYWQSFLGNLFAFFK